MHSNNFCLHVFYHVGSVNDHLLAFERSVSDDTTDDDDDDDGDADDVGDDDVNEIAKTMMVFMVRGLFTRLRFPYAQFACTTVTGDLLYHPFWQTVFRLERMQLKVMCVLKFHYMIISVV